MDSTADSPSRTARHTPITRRLVVAVGGLFVLGVLVAIAALFNIAQKLDAEDLRKTHFYTAVSYTHLTLPTSDLV